jgi:predicted transposase YbfD/YdcC
LVSKATSGEELDFPLAQQVALLCRQCQGRKEERVALVTSVPLSRLDAATWLQLNRQHWGIESGLHQRLDVSHNDDRCRVRNHNAMGVLAMMRRLSNSLFMHWRQGKRRPDHVTTTDFQSFLSEDHHRQAMRLVLVKSPRL